MEVYFYRTVSGNEPVKEWLKSLPKEDMKTIGTDIKTVQLGYPIGMHAVNKSFAWYKRFRRSSLKHLKRNCKSYFLC